MENDLMERVFDLAIIGGGINGLGCAADAALRGLSVLLCEKDDIAAHTSSSSSKLIHGGLRYLEHHDFLMVKKALDEQQKLLHIAPHLVRPLRFVLPHKKNNRPLWLLKLGLFLYDHLSLSNKLPTSRFIRRKQQQRYFSPLKPYLNEGFYFYDCTTDDARLTLVNALLAKQHGASILTQTELLQAQAENDQWQLTLQKKSGDPFQVQAKVIINATGPWVEHVNTRLHISSQYQMSLVKGSHLVVKKLYPDDHAYLLQHDDKRIIFVIPYHDYSLIGTTEVIFKDSLDRVRIEEDEIDYLCTLTNHYFSQQISRNDIVHTWSGVRPLISSKSDKSPAELSRDYTFHFSNQPSPAITIYGGKITTYRQLASQVIEQLRVIFPNLAKSSSATTLLPGATLGNMDLVAYQQYAQAKYAWLEPSILKYYLSQYGTCTEKLLLNRYSMADLGKQFTPLLYQNEVDYLVEEEWATTSDDILWRRTKQGLQITPKRKQDLDEYLDFHATA
jgi:glycerol-3-phosphate dehydrogenase